MNTTSTSVSDARNAWTEYIGNVHPLILVSISVGGTCLITILSVLMMLCLKKLNGRLLTVFYACSVGTMTSVATLGLINAALLSARDAQWSRDMPWIPVVTGMGVGLAVLQIMTSIVDYLYKRLEGSGANRLPKGSGKREGEYALQEDDDDDDEEGGDIATNDSVAVFNDLPLTKLQLNILDKKKHAEQQLGGGVTASALAAPRTVLNTTREKLLTPHPPLNTRQRRIQRAIMLVTVTLLQQLPEGLSVGIAIGSIAQSDASERNRAVRIAITTTLASWISSLPEVVALLVPLRECGVKRTHILATILVSMAFELCAAVASTFLVAHVRAVMSFALAGAGSATLFAVMSELVAAAYEHDYRGLANVFIMTSFAGMMVIINLFG